MIDCAIIRDLLPLYVDDVLSKESKALVSEHLAACESCMSEFTKMQSEFVKLPPINGAKIKALKSMKRKLFKKNVMVSLGSIAVLVVFALGFINWVLLPQTPIPYEDGLLRVETNTTKVARDENGNLFVYASDSTTLPFMPFEERGVLDIISSRKTANRSATTIYLEENGERIQIAFVNFTESLLSKWEPGGETAYSFRIIEPQNSQVLSENGMDVEWEVFDRIEVYYIDQFISEINAQNDYNKLRSDGTLLWSGVLN